MLKILLISYIIYLYIFLRPGSVEYAVDHNVGIMSEVMKICCMNYHIWWNIKKNKGERLFSLLLSDEKHEIERFISLKLRISDSIGNIFELFSSYLINVNS